MAHLKPMLIKIYRPLRSSLISFVTEGSRSLQLVFALLLLSASWAVYTVHSSGEEDPLIVSVKNLEESYKKVFTKKKWVCNEEVLQIINPKNNDPEYVAYELQFKQLRADLEIESDKRSLLSERDPKVGALLKAIRGYYEFMLLAYANDVRSQHEGMRQEKLPGYMFSRYQYELNLSPRVGLLLWQSPEYKLSYSLRHVKNEQGEFDKIQLYLDPDTKKKTELMVLSEPKNPWEYGKLLTGHVLRESLANRWGLRRIDTVARTYKDPAILTCGLELVSFQLGEGAAGNRSYDPSRLGEMLKSLRTGKSFNPADFAEVPSLDPSSLKIQTAPESQLPKLEFDANGKIKNVTLAPGKSPSATKTIQNDVIYSSLEADDRYTDLMALKESIVPKMAGHPLFTDEQYIDLVRQVQKLNPQCASRFLHKNGATLLEEQAKSDPAQAADLRKRSEALKKSAAQELAENQRKYAIEGLKAQEDEHYTYVLRTEKDAASGIEYTRLSMGVIALAQMNLPGDAMDPASIAERLADRVLKDRRELLIYMLADDLANCKKVGEENLGLVRETLETEKKKAAEIQKEKLSADEKWARLNEEESDGSINGGFFDDGSDSEVTATVEAPKTVAEAPAAEKTQEKAVPKQTVAKAAPAAKAATTTTPEVTNEERLAIRELVQVNLKPHANQWRQRLQASLMEPLKVFHSPEYRAQRNSVRFAGVVKQIHVALTQGTMATQTLEDFERLAKAKKTEIEQKRNTPAVNSNRESLQKRVTYKSLGGHQDLAETSAYSAKIRRIVPETPDQLSQFYYKKLTTFAEGENSPRQKLAQELLQSRAVNTTMTKFFAAVAEQYNKKNEGGDPSILIGDNASCSPNLLGHYPKTCGGAPVYLLGDAVEEVLPKVIKQFVRALSQAPVVAAARPPVNVGSVAAPSAGPLRNPPPKTMPKMPEQPKPPRITEPKFGGDPLKFQKAYEAYERALAEYPRLKKEYDQYWKDLNQQAAVARVKKTIPTPKASTTVPDMKAIPLNSLGVKDTLDVSKLSLNSFDPHTAEGRACMVKNRLANLKLPDLGKLNLNPEAIFIKEKDDREKAKQLFAEALAVLNLYYRFPGVPEENSLTLKTPGEIAPGSFRAAEEAVSIATFQSIQGTAKKPVAAKAPAPASQAPAKTMPTKPVQKDPKDSRPYQVRLDEYYKARAAYDQYWKAVGQQSTAAIITQSHAQSDAARKTEALKSAGDTKTLHSMPARIQDRIALSVSDQALLAEVMRTSAASRAPLLVFQPYDGIERTFYEKGKDLVTQNPQRSASEKREGQYRKDTVLELVQKNFDHSTRSWNRTALEAALKDAIQIAIENDHQKVETFCQARMNVSGNGPNEKMRLLGDTATAVRTLLTADDENLAKIDAEFGKSTKSFLWKNEDWMNSFGMLGLAVIAVMITGGVAAAVAGSVFGISLFGAAAGGAAAGGTAGAFSFATLSNFMIPLVVGDFGVLGVIGMVSTPVMVGLWGIEKPPQERFIYEVANSSHGLTGKILVDREKMKESQEELRTMQTWTHFAVVAEVAAYRIFTHRGIRRTLGITGVEKAKALTKNLPDSDAALKSILREDREELVRLHGEKKAGEIISKRQVDLVKTAKRISALKEGLKVEELEAVLRQALAKDLVNINLIEEVLQGVLKKDLSEIKALQQQIKDLGKPGSHEAQRSWTNFLTGARLVINKRIWKIAMSEQAMTGMIANTAPEFRAILLMNKTSELTRRVEMTQKFLSYVSDAKMNPTQGVSASSRFFDRLQGVGGEGENEISDFMVYIRKGYDLTLNDAWLKARKTYKRYEYLEEDLRNMNRAIEIAAKRSSLIGKAVQDGEADVVIKGDGTAVTDPALVKKAMLSEPSDVILIDEDNLLAKPKRK